MYARTSITLDQDHCHRPLNEHSSYHSWNNSGALFPPSTKIHAHWAKFFFLITIFNFKSIGTIDYVCLPFYLRYGSKNLDTFNKRVFWNLEGYYIQFLEFTGHPYITFVPLEIFTVPWIHCSGDEKVPWWLINLLLYWYFISLYIPTYIWM